jgi:uncharacterized RDD family membrane protein YckC
MVSTPKAYAGAVASVPTPPPVTPIARINARCSAYLIDSLALMGFILLFFIIAGALLLSVSDLGKQDAPDSAYYAFIAIFLGGCLISWTLFNVAMLLWRGQTLGMFIIGIRSVDEGFGPLSAGQIVLHWFALHPLFFHPLLLPIWGLGALLVVSVTLSSAVLVIAVALTLLCLLAPAVSLVAMLLDPEHRTLPDRIARSVVIHIDPQ